MSWRDAGQVDEWEKLGPPLPMYAAGTERVYNAVKLLRGTVDEVDTVGVFLTTDPGEVPEPADFTTVTLLDGTADPADAGSQEGVVDIAALLGVGGDVTPGAGLWHEWALVTAGDEKLMRMAGRIEVR